MLERIKSPIARFARTCPVASKDIDELSHAELLEYTKKCQDRLRLIGQWAWETLPTHLYDSYVEMLREVKNEV